MQPKNRFMFFTLIKLLWVYCTGYFIIEIHPLKGPVKINHRSYHSLKSFLYIKKQQLLAKKKGESQFLKMTIKEILTAKI